MTESRRRVSTQASPPPRVTVDARPHRLARARARPSARVMSADARDVPVRPESASSDARDRASDEEAWQTVKTSRRPSFAKNSRRSASDLEDELGGRGRGNAFAVIAPPRTPRRAEDGTREAREARRRAKKRARRLRRTSAALRVLGGGSTGQESEDGDGEEGEEEEEEDVESYAGIGVVGLAAVAARAAAEVSASERDGVVEGGTYEKEEGEITPVLKMRTIPAMPVGERPPIPGRIFTTMSPPRPRPPRTPKTPPATPGVDAARVDADEHQNWLDWFFHRMDLTFAGVMLAVYAFYDTVMKFIGIKILRVSMSSRRVRQTEARVAKEQAAVEEFEEIISKRKGAEMSSVTPTSTSEVEDHKSHRRTRGSPPSATTSASTKDDRDSSGRRIKAALEEGELTPSHALRRRLSSSLGGAWGSGAGAPPSFRVARVDEESKHAHNELVSCVGSRGDEYITGGWDGTLRTWRWDPTKGLSGGTPMTGQHNDNVEFLSVDAREDQEYLAISGGRDCTVRIWDVRSRSQRQRIYAFENIASGCVDWQSQTIAVGSRGGAVMLWDAEKGTKKCTLRGHDGEVTSMCTYDWSEGGATLYVSGGADGVVRVWDARQHVAVATMNEHRGRVYAVCPGPKGVIFAGDFSSNVKVHSLSNPGAMPRLLPNVPGVDGCEAPIAGLQFLKLDGMRGGGLLLSTAAYFPLNENGEESDDDDAPQGCVHVRAVDASGMGLGAFEDKEGDGYLYTLKGIEGLLTCTSLTASSDGNRMRLVVGAGSGALGAYAEGGSLSGQPSAANSDVYHSTIELADELGVESYDD